MLFLLGNMCLRRPDKETQAATDELLSRGWRLGPQRDMAGLHELQKGGAESAAPRAGVVGGRRGDGLDALLTRGDPAQIFRLGAVLGRGEFGEVYRATDRRDGKQVAVKLVPLPPRDGDDAERAAAVDREVRAQVRADGHPGVAHVYGVFAAEPAPRVRGMVGPCVPRGATAWLVQELVDAPPGAPRSVADAVAALPEGRGAPTPAAQELLRSVGSALAHIHARGVLHRDVKPENILLDAAGSHKLVDFGSAAVLRAGEERAASTALVGSWPYIAPEAYDGEYSAKVDAFSLGCVAAELWLGRGRGPLELPLAAGGAAPLLAEVAAEAVQAATDEAQRAALTRVAAAVRGPILQDAGARLGRRARGAAAQERGARRGHARALGRLLAAMLAADPAARPAAHEVLTELSEPRARRGGGGAPAEEP